MKLPNIAFASFLLLVISRPVSSQPDGPEQFVIRATDVKDGSSDDESENDHDAYNQDDPEGRGQKRAREEEKSEDERASKKPKNEEGSLEDGVTFEGGILNLNMNPEDVVPPIPTGEFIEFNSLKEARDAALENREPRFINGFMKAIASKLKKKKLKTHRERVAFVLTMHDFIHLVRYAVIYGFVNEFRWAHNDISIREKNTALNDAEHFSGKVFHGGAFGLRIMQEEARQRVRSEAKGYFARKSGSWPANLDEACKWAFECEINGSIYKLDIRIRLQKIAKDAAVAAIRDAINMGTVKPLQVRCLFDPGVSWRVLGGDVYRTGYRAAEHAVLNHVLPDFDRIFDTLYRAALEYLPNPLLSTPLATPSAWIGYSRGWLAPAPQTAMIWLQPWVGFLDGEAMAPVMLLLLGTRSQASVLNALPEDLVKHLMLFF